MSVLLALIFITNALILAGGLLLVRRIRQRIDQFITPQGKDELSELAQYVDLCGQVFINRAMISLNARDNQARSVEVRQSKAMDQAIVQDSIGQINPLFGILARQYPNVVKQLAKNQDLLPYILQMAGNMANKSNNHHEAEPPLIGINTF